MDKNKQKKTSTQNNKGRKILLGTLIPFSLLVTAAAGFGAGYLIRHKNSTQNSYPYFRTTLIDDSFKSDGTGSATFKINTYNNAQFNNIAFSSIGPFRIDDVDVSASTYTLSLKGRTDPRIYYCNVGCGLYGYQKVGIPVSDVPPSAIKSISATIDGPVHNGDRNGKSTITVTAFNGADLSRLQTPTQTGFKFTNTWGILGNKATCDVNWDGATDGTEVNITNDEESTKVYVAVLPPSTKSISATIDGPVQNGDTNIKSNITVTAFNGANLTSLRLPTQTGFEFSNSWTVVGTTATCEVNWNGATGGAEVSITNDVESTKVYVAVLPPSPPLPYNRIISNDDLYFEYNSSDAAYYLWGFKTSLSDERKTGMLIIPDTWNDGINSPHGVRIADGSFAATTTTTSTPIDNDATRITEIYINNQANCFATGLQEYFLDVRNLRMLYINQIDTLGTSTPAGSYFTNCQNLKTIIGNYDTLPTGSFVPLSHFPENGVVKNEGNQTSADLLTKFQTDGLPASWSAQ